MNVMTAGMHTAVIGGKRETGQFLKGKGVHISSQKKCFPARFSVTKNRADSRFSYFLEFNSICL